MSGAVDESGPDDRDVEDARPVRVHAAGFRDALGASVRIDTAAEQRLRLVALAAAATELVDHHAADVDEARGAGLAGRPQQVGGPFGDTRVVRLDRVRQTGRRRAMEHHFAARDRFGQRTGTRQIATNNGDAALFQARAVAAGARERDHLPSRAREALDQRRPDQPGGAGDEDTPGRHRTHSPEPGLQAARRAAGRQQQKGPPKRASRGMLALTCSRSRNARRSTRSRDRRRAGRSRTYSRR